MTKSLETLPARVVERYLRLTFGRYASRQYEELSEGVSYEGFEVPERPIGRYTNMHELAGTSLVFTVCALYQFGSEVATRVPYVEVGDVVPPAVDKGLISSVTLTLASGERVEIFMDGGNGARDALQLHQFFTNLFAARARGAEF